MSLKKVILALALASLTGIAWLGLSVSPAAATSPAAQLTQLDKEIGMSAKQSGKHHGKHHGKHGKHHGKHKSS